MSGSHLDSATLERNIRNDDVILLRAFKGVRSSNAVPKCLQDSLDEAIPTPAF